MRSLFVIFVGTLSFVLSGCTGVQSVGSLAIPESGFAVYDIRGEHGLSPSWSAGVIVNAAGEAVIVAPGTEGGLAGRLIGSGTSLGSAYLFGHSIRPDTYTDSSSTVVSSGSAAGAAAGAIGVGNGGAGGSGGQGGGGGNADNRPPDNRPPDNRPPRHRGEHGDDDDD